MNQKLIPAAIVAAALTLGFSIPSCPGQEAIQQQIDGLTSGQADLKKHVQALDSQVKALGSELTQARTLVTELSDTVTQQKETIARLETSLQEQGARLAAAEARLPRAATPRRAGSRAKQPTRQRSLPRNTR